MTDSHNMMVEYLDAGMFSLDNIFLILGSNSDSRIELRKQKFQLLIKLEKLTKGDIKDDISTVLAVSRDSVVTCPPRPEYVSGMERDKDGQVHSFSTTVEKSLIHSLPNTSKNYELRLTTQGQNIYRNEKSRSPFQPPAFDSIQWNTPEKELKVEKTTSEIPTTTVSSTDNTIVKVDSPFSPPDKQEWHKSSSWLSSLEARQQHNTQSIPALSNIDLNKEHHKFDETKRPKPRTKRPKISVYQHRDMHDAAPGVTPWTRYTEKPKTSEDSSWSSWSSKKTYAQCGYQSYSPRSEICCQGKTSRRQGIQPSCCGSQSYDTVFSKCCNGVVSLRSSPDANC
ncbi:hypothetical protein Btru_059464 [Bulinus truncatus]|nr:hypothetical protein Btru_059464 [Bulinus truncatus]